MDFHKPTIEYAQLWPMKSVEKGPWLFQSVSPFTSRSILKPVRIPVHGDLSMRRRRSP